MKSVMGVLNLYFNNFLKAKISLLVVDIYQIISHYLFVNIFSQESINGENGISENKDNASMNSEDDDDDEDDVQVTIGDIRTWTGSEYVG